MTKAVTYIVVALSFILTGLCGALLVVYLPSSTTNVESMKPYKDCAARSYSFDSVVCVCNSTYCDTIEQAALSKNGTAVSYLTTKEGQRLRRSEMKFQTVPRDNADAMFTINFNKRFQTIKGFGGAFTDAAGININSLSSEAQERLLRSYFSAAEGIEYNIGRIPMASCDFSTRLYTYADEPDDFELKNFALAKEDLGYKIPIIKRAMLMNEKKMSFFGSPWSAPAWMKTNNNLTGKGSLIGEAGNKYHQTWALYFARFIEEYKSHGIDMWGVTAQNEPKAGLVQNFPFQCMGFTAEQQRDFVKTDLGPMLSNRGHGDVEVMVGDEQRIEFPEWAQVVLSDPEAARYVSGIAVHWYTDWLSDPTRLSRTHELYPNHFILGSEACAGSMPWHNDVQLGNWVRGERYSQDILQDLTNWAVGWVDWNLVLDMRGGPNWVSNFVDAPIIVNPENDEFYKQPTFYHLGHFSKFIPEGSVRLGVTGPEQSGSLKYAAFFHPDGSTISLVILNVADQSFEISLEASGSKYIHATVPAKSIQTYLWLND